ncbi:MAG: hypothetical protein ACTHK8_19040 [Ginsengibacter sp.]
MDKKQALIGEVSEEKIQEWKKKYGHVWAVKIEGSICYLKKASRATLRAALGFLEKDRIKYMEIIVENSWLGGDEDIKTNDEYFYALMEVVPQLVEAKDAEIKKL